MGALAIDERQGDQYGWAVDYETAATALRGWVWLFFVGGPKRFLRAARQELLDPSKLWWRGWWGRLADRRRCSFSVSLGVIPLVFARFVEVPVRVEVAAGS